MSFKADETIPNDTKVLVKGDSNNIDFIGIIVGSNEEDSEEFGLHYYIVPEGENDDLMFERKDFEII